MSNLDNMTNTVKAAFLLAGHKGSQLNLLVSVT